MKYILFFLAFLYLENTYAQGVGKLRLAVEGHFNGDDGRFII